MITRLLLIPHCTTEHNIQKRLQGQLNTTLNNDGKHEAMNLPSIFSEVDIAAIYSSDLSRCVESAKHLAASKNLKIKLHKGLRGRHYGMLQGMRYEDIEKKLPKYYQALKKRDPYIRFCKDSEKCESLLEFNQRSVNAVLECLSTHKESIIAIVTHGGVADCIFRLAEGFPVEKQVNGRLYSPLKNYFLFENGQFHICTSRWKKIKRF